MHLLIRESLSVHLFSAYRWWICAAVLLALVVGVYAYERPAAGQVEHSAAAAKTDGGRGGGRGAGPAVPVQVAKAITTDMPVYLTALGTVTALQTVAVHTRVDGQLIRVNFKEGQLVHAGDLLAEIDPRPFQVQLTQAQGQLARDEAALKNAQLDLERYQTLFAQDAVAKQQLDTQAATVSQAQGTIVSDQGQVAAADLNVTYAHVTSPITGRVGLRLVDPGNIVHASDQNGIVMITKRQPIAVVFTIPEDNLPAVLERQRQSQTLSVAAYDRDMTTKLADGSLSSIDSQIDTSTGTIKLKAVFANQGEPLFPNQFVNARLLINTIKNAVVVPSVAIQRGPQDSFVYVVKADETVETRTVDVQLAEADRSAIKSGLAAGETVVTDGLDKLQPGSKVAVRESASAGTSAP